MGFINAKIFPNQILYFLLFSGIGPIVVFMPTIVKQMGFSASTLGLIAFSLPIISIFSRIIFGIMADKYHTTKFILIACLLTSAVSIGVFPFLRQRGNDVSETLLQCQPDGTTIQWSKASKNYDAASLTQMKCEVVLPDDDFLDLCSNWKLTANKINMSNSLDLDCRDVEIDVQFGSKSFWGYRSQRGVIHEATFNDLKIASPSCLNDTNSTSWLDCTEHISLAEEIFTHKFLYIFFLLNCYSLGYYVSTTFCDTISYNLIGTSRSKGHSVIGLFLYCTRCIQMTVHLYYESLTVLAHVSANRDEPHLFGKIRVFGSFGDGLASLTAGVMLDYFASDSSSAKSYLPMYILVASMFTLAAIWANFLKINQDNKIKFDLKKISMIFVEFDTVVFALWSFTVGFYQQMAWQYSFWYTEEIASEEDTYLKTLQGIYEALNTVVGEFIAFYGSGVLMRKLGVKTCMSLNLLMGGIRFFCFSILSRPIWVLPIGVVDGMVFGLQYALITSYCDSIAASGTKTTVQAIFGGIYDGIGTSLGALCAGIAYEYFGGATAFRLYAYFSFVSCALHVVATRLSRLRRNA